MAAVRERRGIQKRIKDLERSIEGLRKSLVDQTEADIKDVASIFPILREIRDKAATLQSTTRHTFQPTTTNLEEVYSLVSKHATLLINQGARAHLPLLLQIKAECSKELGKLRDCRKCTKLAVKFNSADNEDILEFKREVDMLTYKHAIRGLIMISAFGALGTMLTNMVTKRLRK
mmetsp:Transcript_36529/g.70834  ORF Transcript_36529/g.70834 Transcript_36529/m.70834 type:complete len:175 (-) Transcript_36529:65-589(-)